MQMLPAISLARRELVRFLRQRHRIIGALATPIVFWLLIGAGMGRSFQTQGPGGDDYIQFFFPGTILMILLFTAIFSTISVIEDRREGFLQSVLVAPIPRTAIVLGKLLGGTILAFGQGLIFLILAPTVGIHLTFAGVIATSLIMLIVSFALTGLGFSIAWRMSSTQGFHAIMNLFLIPLWFLSGSLFPPEGAKGPLAAIMKINPLTYGLTGLRRAIYWNLPFTDSTPSYTLSLLISLAFAIAMYMLSAQVSRKTIPGDLQ